MANFFTTLAKFLAHTALKAKLGNSKEIAEMEKMQENTKYHADRLDKLLEEICRRDPNNWRCKEYLKKHPFKKPRPYNVEEVAKYIYENFENEMRLKLNLADVIKYLKIKKAMFDAISLGLDSHKDSLVASLDKNFTEDEKRNMFEIESEFLKNNNMETPY